MWIPLRNGFIYDFYSGEAKLSLALREGCRENPLSKIAAMIGLEFTFMLLYRVCLEHIRKISGSLSRVQVKQS